jgi:DNA-directed RNA polymerase specialized sigma24 family protein
MKTATESEEDFSHLLREIQAGREPVSAIIGHPEFILRARSICYQYQFKDWRGVYGPEDLCQDACMKMLRYNATILDSNNISGEEEFFKWFYVVARAAFLTAYRRLMRFKLTRSVTLIPIEESPPIKDPGADSEGKCFLSEFLKFTAEKLPAERRHAVELWLQGYSSRETAAILNDAGIMCSHTTTQNWVSASLRTFKENISQGRKHY